MWSVHTAVRKAVLTGCGPDERAAGGAWRVRSAEDGVGRWVQGWEVSSVDRASVRDDGRFWR